MQITMNLGKSRLAVLTFILIVIAGAGYTSATRANGVWHPAEDVVSPYGGTAITYPVEIRETTSGHSGKFGDEALKNGYSELYKWIDTNGCPHSEGWHVCYGWEIVHVFQHGSAAARCGDGGCSGRYLSGGGNHGHIGGPWDNECGGWTNDASEWGSPYWDIQWPSRKPCNSEYYKFLCCR